VPIVAVAAHGQLNVHGGLDAVVHRGEHEVELPPRIGAVARIVNIVVERILRVGHQAESRFVEMAEIRALSAAHQTPA